jgi:hypothetical protein
MRFDAADEHSKTSVVSPLLEDIAAHARAETQLVRRRTDSIF